MVIYMCHGDTVHSNSNNIQGFINEKYTKIIKIQFVHSTEQSNVNCY